MIAALLLAAAAPQPGRVHTWGDWSVACDNVKRCGAAPLVPEDEVVDNLAIAAVTREAGARGQATISLYTEGRSGLVTVRIDTRAIARVIARSTSDVTELRGDDALAVLRAAASGRTLEVDDAAGHPIGSISLAGAAAAMRFIDAEQGRTGTRSAIVARGVVPAARVPPPPTAPAIRAVRPGGTPGRLQTAQLARLRAAHRCDEQDPDTAASTASYAALGGGATLALIRCHSGPYQGGALAYVLRAGRASLARLDSNSADGEVELDEPAWDTALPGLTTRYKGRGRADCGFAQQFVWDGARFRLVEQQEMSPCRGNRDLIRTWTARVVR